jgi:aryl sulfotransferase
VNRTARDVPNTAGDAVASGLNGENSPDAVLRQQESYLREVRAASERTLSVRLSAAGFADISQNALLLLSAMFINEAAARELIRKLGIDSQAAGQSLETLIQDGYLKLPDNSDERRGPDIAITEQGHAVLNEAQSCVLATRWADFPFRPGDIVICTTPKSGTTWMQMICALLIFQTTELPAPMPVISPWMDYGFARDETFAKLAAQEHRRFIKTHAPLNDIPADPRVTYIVVGRHPLDAAVSQHHQNRVLLSGNASRPSDDPGRAQERQRQWLVQRITRMGTSPGRRPSYFDKMLTYLVAVWARRNEPNVVLVHYEDLSADLSGEMRRLAARLDITVPEAKWPSLVEAATFKQMRATADRIQPLRDADGASQDQAGFFRRGASGDGPALLTDDELAVYHTRAAQVAPPDLLAWLHHQDEHAASRLPARGRPDGPA